MLSNSSEPYPDEQGLSHPRPVVNRRHPHACPNGAMQPLDAQTACDTSMLLTRRECRQEVHLGMSFLYLADGQV